MQVLLLPPNIIGHCRLTLLAAAVHSGHRGHHLPSLSFFASSFALDCVDGYLARTLHQETDFGALYDVLIDITGRAVLWTWRSQSPLATIPVIIECFTFTFAYTDAARRAEANKNEHSTTKTSWKDVQRAPRWAEMVMTNGLRNPLGAIAAFGLFACPLWLYARRVIPQAATSTVPWGVVPVMGRLLAGSVELTLIGTHIHGLLTRDAEALTRRKPPL
jgi:phosphatidylglycerophosphate synthase